MKNKNFLKKLTAGILGFVMTLGVGAAGYSSVANETKAANKELSFSFSSNITGWPTATGSSASNKTYTLSGVSYTFSLGKNVYCNSSYLMLKSTTYLGLPAITDYKLTKVVAHSSTGHSTSTKVGISSSSSSASYVSGGSAQTWSTKNSNYTYTLSNTSAGTMYYIYVTSNNTQITNLTLTYEPTVITSTVTLNNQGATTAGTTSVTATKGSAMPSITVPEKTGSDFQGYYTSTNGGGTKYYNADGTSARNWDQEADTTLYAYWKTKTYIVSYNKGDYGTGDNSSATKTYDVSLTLSSALFSRPGYKQTAWSKKNDGSTEDYGLGASYTENATLTLYPYWTKKEHVELTADDIEIDLQTQASGVAPSNPSHEGITYKVVNDSVVEWNGSVFIPKAEGNTVVNMSKEEDANYTYSGSFQITVTSQIQSYEVSWSSSKYCDISGDNLIYERETKTYIITANSGYKLPSTITVNGAEQSYEVTDNQKYTTATLTISNPTEDVSIVCNAIALETYTISYGGENYTHSNITSIVEFGSQTITLTANEHCDLPDSVTVTGATYNYSNGSLTISNPTANVVITCNAIARAHYTITVEEGEHFTATGYSGGIYATENAEVNISPESDMYVIRLQDIEVKNATKVSYSSNKLKISNPTANVSITVTPVRKVIQSISAAASTKTFELGKFSPNGFVITGTYNTGDTVSIPVADCEFSCPNPADFYTAGTNKTIVVTHKATGATTQVSGFTFNAITPGSTVTWSKLTSATQLNNGEKVYFHDDSSSSIGYVTGYSSSDATVSTTSSSRLEFVVESADKTANTFKLKDPNTNNYITSNASNKFSISATQSSAALMKADSSGRMWYIDSNSANRYLAINGSYKRCYTSTSSYTPFYAYISNTITVTKSLIGIIAINVHVGDFKIGQSVSENDFAVTAYYNDGTNNSVDDFTITSSKALLAENNEITISYTDSVLEETKTCTINVPAVKSTAVIEKVDVVVPEDYSKTYYKDGSNPLSWDYTGIKVVATYDDKTTAETNLETLVASSDSDNKVTINPESPNVGDKQFTVSGKYLGHEIDGNNVVTGIDVVAKAVKSLSWPGRFDGYGFDVFAGDKVNKSQFAKQNSSSYIKLTYNNGESINKYSIDNCSVALYRRSDDNKQNIKVKDVTFDSNGDYTFEASDDGLYFLLSVGDIITQYSADAVFNVCDKLNPITKDVKTTISITTSDFDPELPTSAGGEVTYTAKGLEFNTKGLYNFQKTTTGDCHIALPKSSSDNQHYIDCATPIDGLKSLTIHKGDQSINTASSIFAKTESGEWEYVVNLTGNDGQVISFDQSKGYKYFSITSTGNNYTNIKQIDIYAESEGSYSNQNVSVQKSVISFAKTFNETYKDGIEITDWATIASNYNSLISSFGTDAEKELAKNMFKYATASNATDADCLQKCVKAYDDAAKAYNKVSTTGTNPDNFMLRDVGSATQYTITYINNGHAVTGGAQNGYYNATIQLPTKDSSVKGYVLEGWYTDPTFDTGKVNDGDKLTSNLTLYAKWSIAKPTITFDGNGATWADGSTSVEKTQTYGTTVVFPDTNPTKQGYTWDENSGWYTKDGTNGDWGEKFTATTVNFEENITLYARLSIESYDITFNYMDASGKQTSTTNTFDYNTTPTLSVPSTCTTSTTVYTFTGWEDANGKTYPIGTDLPKVSGEATYTATYSSVAREYTVTYNSNGGTSVAPQSVANGTSVPLPVPTKLGVVFAGWEYNGTIYNEDKPLSMPTENITLNAVWQLEGMTTITENILGGELTFDYLQNDESIMIWNLKIRVTSTLNSELISEYELDDMVTYGFLIADTSQLDGKTLNDWFVENAGDLNAMKEDIASLLKATWDHIPTDNEFGGKLKIDISSEDAQEIAAALNKEYTFIWYSVDESGHYTVTSSMTVSVASILEQQMKGMNPNSKLYQVLDYLLTLSKGGK